MAWIDPYLHDGQPSQPKHHSPGVHGAILLGNRRSWASNPGPALRTFGKNRELNSIAAWFLNLIYRGHIESLAIGSRAAGLATVTAKFIASPAEPGRLPNQLIVRPRSEPQISPSIATLAAGI